MTVDVNVEADALEHALTWLAAVIDAGLRLAFGTPCEVKDIREITPPEWAGDGSAYASLIARHGFGFDEQVVLCLALAPHLRPRLLDSFLIKNPLIDRVFTEFGGVLDRTQEGFRPTLQTAAFLLAGDNLGRRLALRRLFDEMHPFHRTNILRFDQVAAGASLFTTLLEVEPACLALLTGLSDHRSPVIPSFPARRITSALDWDDLVLTSAASEEIKLIAAWLTHRDGLAEHPLFGQAVKPGYRALFHGPPGTGKTATAAIIGKRLGLDVYRVDLSIIISKWVGETEKNLGAVFDVAETRRWILFFDEADALFGKRTATASSNDRYANQQVSFLLQRIEDYPGLIILASNLKSNLDDAFARRFQSMIYFAVPGPRERLRLWHQILGTMTRLDPAIDLETLAERYELTGGAIVNIVHYSVLMALNDGSPMLRLVDLQQGIRREFGKSGKTI